MLIDAHYQQLVLSPDSQEVLISLHRTVEGQVNTCTSNGCKISKGLFISWISQRQINKFYDISMGGFLGHLGCI